MSIVNSIIVNSIIVINVIVNSIIVINVNVNNVNKVSMSTMLICKIQSNPGGLKRSASFVISVDEVEVLIIIIIGLVCEMYLQIKNGYIISDY